MRDGAGERQPETRTARDIAAGFFQPHERLEYLLQPVLRDAGSIVVDGGHKEFRFLLERDAGDAAIADRILDEVANCPPDFVGPAVARGYTLNLDFHRLIELDQVVADAFDQRREIDPARFFARPRARCGKHRLGHGLQFFKIAQQPFAHFLVLDEFGGDAHGRERRP